MPEWRKLHVKVKQSDDINDMPDDFCRVFWYHLILTVDKEGRGINKAAWLRSNCFPIRDDVTVEMIETAMRWMITRGMVVTYSANDKSYFYIPSFKMHQSTDKEAKSILPSPELVQTYSGVSPELVQSLSSTEESRVEKNREEKSRGGASDNFSQMVSLIQTSAGILVAGDSGIQAVNELIEIGATEEDIKSAVNWFSSQGKVIRQVSSILGPVKFAIAKRKQSTFKPDAKNNDDEYLSPEQFMAKRQAGLA